MDKTEIDQERHDVEWILSTQQGRRFAWRLLSHCGIYRDIEGEGPEVFKQVGRRQVGLFLLELISDASEDRLFEMMKEAKSKALEEKIQHERDNRKHSIDSYIDTGVFTDYPSDGPNF